MKPRLIACIRWRNNASGKWYCEYYDKRTGGFLAIGIGTSSSDAEIRATRHLQTVQLSL